MTELVRRRGRRLPFGLALVVALGTVVGLTHAGASASTQVVRSVVKGTDGKNYWVTNHLVMSDKSAAAVANDKPAGHHEYLLVWAGESESTLPEKVDEFVTQLAAETTKELGEKGLLSSK